MKEFYKNILIDNRVNPNDFRYVEKTMDNMKFQYIRSKKYLNLRW